ncbi:MAG: DUF3990 domain-containing protein [Bacteroidales bacterium]|nr:DUF3990 domain-containing protein [Bacteroidales bacterium]
MTLYHGSNVEINGIDLSRGRSGKDFGKGFYLSVDMEQAKSMAQIVFEREGKGSPIVTSFLFDDSVADKLSLKIKRFNDYSKDWAEFILKNRLNQTNEQLHDYDIVYGPIANDKVGVQIQLYRDEFITIDELISRLKYVRPTYQYFFGTERAISLLTKNSVEL